MQQNAKQKSQQKYQNQAINVFNDNKFGCNKQYFEEAIYEITIPIIDQDEGTNNQECWCKKCTIS